MRLLFVSNFNVLLVTDGGSYVVFSGPCEHSRHDTCREGMAALYLDMVRMQDEPAVDAHDEEEFRRAFADAKRELLRLNAEYAAERQDIKS